MESTPHKETEPMDAAYIKRIAAMHGVMEQELLAAVVEHLPSALGHGPNWSRLPISPRTHPQNRNRGNPRLASPQIRLGLAWLAWLGLAWPGLAGLAWLAWLGWLGLAWLGLAWLVLAWLGWLGLAWPGQA